MDDQSWQAGFLCKLSPRYHSKLISLGESSRYAPREAIFQEGDPSLYLYLVKRGHVALEVTLGAKGRQTLMTVGPGDIFSWSALGEARLETASARAVDEVEVLRIKGGLLQDLCCEDPRLGLEIYRALTEVVSARLMATRVQLLGLFALSTDTRAAS